MATGRPLRALGFAAAGWITVRLVLLWPAIVTVPNLIRTVVPFATADKTPQPMASQLAIELPPPVHRFGAHAVAESSPSRGEPPRMVIALAGLVRFGSAQPIETESETSQSGPVAVPPGLPSPQPAQRSGSRWSVSAWLLARGGSGASLDTPQLTGSQAGVRIAYLVDRKHRLALAARLVTPLKGKGREAALGIDWQPTRLPVRLLVEQRFGLDGQGSGPAALLVGGFGPAPLGGGFTLEGYGEAGAVMRHRLDGFGDGALRLAYPVATVDRVRLDLGTGLWGAAQRGVRRLDIGPSVGATIPIAGKAVRLSVDWRERIAGNARPGSGPAVTLGADF